MDQNIQWESRKTIIAENMMALDQVLISSRQQTLLHFSVWVLDSIQMSEVKIISDLRRRMVQALDLMPYQAQLVYLKYHPKLRRKLHLVWHRETGVIFQKVFQPQTTTTQPSLLRLQTNTVSLNQ
jgi:2-oxo-4-hydroxy-4-carboxy--5-ureidoimidazoline (OHCU) decarboxylase